MMIQMLNKVFFPRYIQLFNPISAGVLENQDMLGGGQFDPPSKSHVLCPNMTNDTSLESSCALLLESAKTFANLQKPLTMPFQICKQFCKILINLIFNQEKLKMCKFPLTGCLQKICNFFSKNLCNSFPYIKGFPQS